MFSVSSILSLREKRFFNEVVTVVYLVSMVATVLNISQVKFAPISLLLVLFPFLKRANPFGGWREKFDVKALFFYLILGLVPLVFASDGLLRILLYPLHFYFLLTHRFELSKRSFYLMAVILVPTTAIPIFMDDRLMSIYTHANMCALIPLLCLMLAYFVSAPSSVLVLSHVYLLINFYFTESRSAFVFWLWLTFLLMTEKYITKSSKILFFLKVIPIVASLAYVSFYAATAIFNWPEAWFTHFLSGRDVIIKQLVPAMEYHSLIPAGFGGSEKIVEEIATKFPWIGAGVRTPHNVMIKVLLETSLFGLLAFLALCLKYLRKNNLASIFLSAMLFKYTFESATPLGVSLISFLVIAPIFFSGESNENGLGGLSNRV